MWYLRLCYLWQVSAYCHNGECNSHQSQCRMWWGDEADDAVTSCYTIFNVLGQFGANCGYNFTSETYLPCSSEYVLFDVGRLLRAKCSVANDDHGSSRLPSSLTWVSHSEPYGGSGMSSRSLYRCEL